MVNYRIIYDEGGFVCHWQVQKRKWFFFWVNVYLPFSSATSAGNEIKELMGS